MKHEKMILLSLMALCFLSSCATPVLDWGKQSLAQKEYDDASTIFHLLLMNDKGNQELKSLYRQSKSKAAQKHLSLGRMFLEGGNLHAAREEFRLTLEYDSQNLEAKKLMGQLKAETDIFKKKMAQAKKFGNKQKYDEALKVLKGVEKLENTFSEIRIYHLYYSTGSFHSHLKKGIGLFEKGDFVGAEKEISFAVQRRSDLPEGKLWQQKARAYIKAEQLTRIAGQTYKRGKGYYESAYKIYSRALALVPTFSPALTGQRKALFQWADEIYALARKRESFERKLALHQALDGYYRCQKLLPHHRDVLDRIQAVKKKLASHYFKEGVFFLSRPRLSYIALAKACFVRAALYNPYQKNLKTYILRTSKLLALRKRQTICITIQGGTNFASKVTKTVAEYIKQHHYPDVVVRYGRGDGIREELNQEVVAQNYNPNEGGAIPYPTLTFEGQIDVDFAKKTGLNNPVDIISKYIAGYKRVQNPEYLRALVQYNHFRFAKSQADYEVGGLKSDLSRIGSKLARAQRDFNKAKSSLDRYRDRYNRLVGRANEYNQRAQNYNSQYNQAISDKNKYNSQAKKEEEKAENYDKFAKQASNPTQKQQYEKLAEQARTNAKNYRDKAVKFNKIALYAKRSIEGNVKLRDEYRDKARAITPDINKWTGIYNEKLSIVNRIQGWYNTAQGAVANALARSFSYERQANSFQNTTNSTSAYLSETLFASYTFSRYFVQVFGKVSVEVRFKLYDEKKVLAPFEISVVDRKKALVQKGVKSTDKNDYSNKRDSLSSARAFQEILRGKILKKLLAKVHFFLQNRHERYYYLAQSCLRKKHTLKAMEDFLLFLSNAGASKKKMIEDAKEWVVDHIKFPLK